MDLFTRWFGGKKLSCFNWFTPTVKIPRKQVAADRHYPAAATAAVVTYAAVAGKRHVISGVHFGYSEAPAAGAVIKIEDVAGTIVYQLPVTAAGPAPINFPDPIVSAAVNTALIITLTSGGGTCTGYLNVLGHDYESAVPTVHP